MQCPTCSGTGVAETVIGGDDRITMRCYTCEGEGEVEDSPLAVLEVTHDDALDRIATALESIAASLRGSVK